MVNRLTRRDFLAASAAAGAAAATGGHAGETPTTFRTRLHKALITGNINEKTLAPMKEAGFEGVECGAWNVQPGEAAKARAVAAKAGMRIHSVMRAWLNLNQPDRVADDVKSMEVALRAAAEYGADAVLMVPCRVGAKGLPEPWEFDIAFDAKTARVSRVVAGDNTPYTAYIEAQNQATEASREALKRLIPAAEKAKVVVAVENVWNNLWVTPALADSFVRSVGSPWVQFYFDIGNHVKYAPPREWIRTFGKSIVKCHVKDFRLNADGHGGRFADIRDGSVDWPTVRTELDKVGYNGWMTIEGSGGLSLQEQSKRLDLILAGQ